MCRHVPNPNRYDALRQMVADFSADGIVDLAWQGCQTYAVEVWILKKIVQNDLGLSYLQVETDYPETDTEQLKVRIEAFLEML